jgi:hypothetical protein
MAIPPTSLIGRQSWTCRIETAAAASYDGGCANSFGFFWGRDHLDQLL